MMMRPSGASSSNTFVQTRRAAVGTLVSELVAVMSNADENDETERDERGVVERVPLVGRFMEQIEGSRSSGRDRAATRGRFRFVEDDNVDEKAVAREFEALIEKLRIFGQGEKADRMEKLVRAMLASHGTAQLRTRAGYDDDDGADAVAAARYALLSLLLQLSGQPLYTVVRGFVYDDESDEMNARQRRILGEDSLTSFDEGRGRGGGGGAQHQHSVLGQKDEDEDENEDGSDGFLSEGSGCSEGRWMSSDSEEDISGESDTETAPFSLPNAAAAARHVRDGDGDSSGHEEAHSGGVSATANAASIPAEEHDDVEAKEIDTDFNDDVLLHAGERADAAEDKTQPPCRVVVPSHGLVDEPLLVRKLLLMVNGIDNGLYTNICASDVHKKGERDSDVQARIWTTSLSHTAIANLVADEARVSESVRWLDETLGRFLDVGTVLEGRSSPTLQAFARSVDMRVRRAMATSHRLDTAARQAELDPLSRCPTLLECHFELKKSVRTIWFLRSITERVLSSIDIEDMQRLDERADIDERDAGVLARVAAAVLNALCAIVDTMYLDSDTRKHEECVRILSETILPYARWTQLWLEEGEVGHAEFMITKVPPPPPSPLQDRALGIDNVPAEEERLAKAHGHTESDGGTSGSFDESSTYLGHDYDLHASTSSHSGADDTTHAQRSTQAAFPAFIRGDAHDIVVAGRCRRLLKMRARSSSTSTRADNLSDAFLYRLRQLCDGETSSCVASPPSARLRPLERVASHADDASRIVDGTGLGILGDLCRDRHAMEEEWELVGMAKVNGIMKACERDSSIAELSVADSCLGSDCGGGGGIRNGDTEEMHRGAASTIQIEHAWLPTTSDILLNECLMRDIRSRCQDISSDFLCSLLGPWGLRRALEGLRDLFLMGKGELLHSFVATLYSNIEIGKDIGDIRDVNDALYESLATPEFTETMELLRDIVAVRVASTPQQHPPQSLTPSPAPSSYRTTPGRGRARVASVPPAEDGLKLMCSVRWPLGLVLDEASLSVYGDCFTFLLKLRGSIFLLDQVHYRLSLRHAAPATMLTRVCIELRHFVVNLHRYVMESVVRREGDVLERALLAATSVDDVRRFHRRFVRHISRYCMVSRDQLWVLLRGKVSSILNLVPTLVSVVRSCEARDWAPLTDPDDETLNKLSRDFARLMNSVMQILHRQAEVASTSSLSMSLLLFLDFNDYWRRQM